MRIVMKFGGSSLATPARLQAAARLAAEERARGNQVAVVVSAQGDTTDELIAKGREVCQQPPERERDVLLSCGEQISVSLMAMQLAELGCPAVSLCGWQAGVCTEDRHGNARILHIDPKRVLEVLDQDAVAVVAGFQGVDSRGDITTIGRGGSDTTAVALADAVHADVCRIYTDVKGVYSADPRMVEDAHVHREISYDEMLEMAALGAKVLHSRAVELAREKQVRVEVRSAFAPEDNGTALCTESGEGWSVRGITCDEPVTMVTVTGLGGADTCRLLSLLSDAGIAIDVIIRSPGSGKGRVRFSVSEEEGHRAVALLKSRQKELGIAGFVTQLDMAKVSVVGNGIHDGCGVAARMLQALQAGSIEPAYITTGDIRVSVILRREQAGPAVRLLHRAFFGE